MPVPDGLDLEVLGAWVRAYPAEAVEVLLETGALEQCGWRFETATQLVDGSIHHGLMSYIPGEAGHRDHERVYRLANEESTQ